VSRPFEKLNGGEFYDLVLIDGRFRVACALRTISEAVKRNTSIRILVDDYLDELEPRPHYHVIEQYAPMTSSAGRMAVFDITPETLLRVPDEAALEAALRDSR
jgi:hypothetical protein